jgi:lysophospholipase L1-like esterase
MKENLKARFIFFLLTMPIVFVNCTHTVESNNEKEVQELTTRNGLPNFFATVNQKDTIRVAYLGGSITAQKGWRVYSLEWMQKQYPQTKFVEINAAIGGTGSNFGAFRLGKQVLEYNPDLVFVEFAVNDDRQSEEAVVRSMEGIVRQIWKQNPQTDICFIYTIKEDFLDTEQAGELPQSAIYMEKVADTYKIPSINFGSEISKQITEGKLMIKDKDNKEVDGVKVFSSDGVHPYVETGHLIYQGVLQRSFIEMASKGKNSSTDHELGKPLADNNLSNAKMLELSSLIFSNDWEFIDIPEEGSEFSQFSRFLTTIAKADHTGQTITAHFKGQAIGFYDLMCYDAGRIIVKVDGLVTDTISRFDKYASYRRMNSFLIGNLENTDHIVTFTTLSEPFEKGSMLNNKEDYANNPEKYNSYNWYVGKVLVDGEMIK